ncbi:hypothetical protein [Nocardioides sp.]|uniref:hypothetical protein n=1 Tax=Nocardioides sp. TaxID=35761 RepID=UPI0035178647
MTTATSRTDPQSRVVAARVLFGSALVTLAGGLVVAVAGLVLDGPGAAGAALVGALAATLVMVTAAMAVDVVATVRPAWSLLVAMLTYLLVVVALAASLTVVSDAERWPEGLPVSWLSAGILGVALTWTVAQVRLATTARIPVFDLPQAGER